MQPSFFVFALGVLAKGAISQYGSNWTSPTLCNGEGALMAGTSKASHDSSALDDFMVAGATAGSSHGQ